MKILHLTNTDIRSDSRILKTMQCIAKSNKTYNVSGIGIDLQQGQSVAKNIEGINIKSVRLKSKEWGFLPKILMHACSVIELTLKMLHQSVKFKPDVIHCNDTMVLPLGVITKWLTKAKLIYDAHELESDRNGLSKIGGKLILLTEKLLWRFVDAVIVVSPSIEKWYLDNIGKKPSAVILNSPVLESHQDMGDSQYLRSKFSIPEKSKILYT